MKYIPLDNQPNVSRTSFESSYPSMRLDSRGYPHITWIENKLGKTEVNYSYWDGLKWSYRGFPKIADTIEGTFSVKNSLILNDDNPFIAYVKKEDNNTVLTVADYSNNWNFNELSVDYDVEWIGVTRYGRDSTEYSSSSSIDSSSSSSIDLFLSSSSSSSSTSSSSSSSSIDSNSTSSSSSFDDGNTIVVVYDGTNSMLKIYSVTDGMWRLIGNKSVEIEDVGSLMIETSERKTAIVYVDENTVKYNFFDIDSMIWDFSSFVSVTSILGDITDIDMDAYSVEDVSYVSIGCLSSTSALSYISNTLCSDSGNEDYQELETYLYSVSIPTDYVVGSRKVAVKSISNTIYQLVMGGVSKLYSGTRLNISVTWNDGEIASFNCAGDGLVSSSVVIDFFDKTTIAVQSNFNDIYFLEGISDTKSFTTPDVTILNDKWVYNVEYTDGELVGVNVDNAVNSSTGNILKDTKGKLAIVDSNT